MASKKKSVTLSVDFNVDDLAKALVKSMRADAKARRLTSEKRLEEVKALLVLAEDRRQRHFDEMQRALWALNKICGVIGCPELRGQDPAEIVKAVEATVHPGRKP